MIYIETQIYLHHKEHLCAIVYAEEGKKFIDNIERFCFNWKELLDEAKGGFEGYPFYDRYKNYDVDFLDKYFDIVSGEDERLDYVLIEPVVVEEGTFSFSGEFFEIPSYM